MTSCCGAKVRVEGHLGKATLPSSLELELTVSHCTGLRKVKQDDFYRCEVRRIVARTYLEEVKKELQLAARGEVTDVNDDDEEDEEDNQVDDIAVMRRNIEKLKDAQTAFNAFPKEGEERLPNAFVSTGFDDNLDNAIAYTDVIRGECNPIWAYKIDDRCLSDDVNYYKEIGPKHKTPTCLLFNVWHDDAIRLDGVPNDEDEEAGRWRRAKARAVTRLAYAKWSFQDICEAANMGEHAVELPLYDAASGMLMEGHSLNISADVFSDEVAPRCMWWSTMRLKFELWRIENTFAYTMKKRGMAVRSKLCCFAGKEVEDDDACIVEDCDESELE